MRVLQAWLVFGFNTVVYGDAGAIPVQHREYLPHVVNGSAVIAANETHAAVQNQFNNSTLNHAPFANGTSTTNSTKHGGITAAASSYWYPNIDHGSNPFAPAGYKWFRNVMDYGAKGDGFTDDTEAITAAITDGGRCTADANCVGSSVLGASVFFPTGTYLISTPLIMPYYTVFIGDAQNLPTLKGTPSFKGIGIIDSDPYFPGGNGAQWYTNQNQFYRQVRNFVFDLTEMQLTDPNNPPCAMHWQVAQATSLQNIIINMPDNADTAAVGIFTENGSGGFMTDIQINGGLIGMRIGSQQFTIRNVEFNNIATAIVHIWNWSFTWQGLTINNCQIGFDATSSGSGTDTGPNFQPTAQITVMDTAFEGVPVGILVNYNTSIILDRVSTSGVNNVVQGSDGSVLLGGSSGTITSWYNGRIVEKLDGTLATGSGNLSPAPLKQPGLLDGSGAWYTRSKPQYENSGTGDFVSVKSFGAVGDGKADDTAALNSAFQSSSIVWIPYGVYKITSTVTIPAGARLVGEAWPQLMGTGSFFGDMAHPAVMIRVGNPGDTGSVEISDLLFTVSGPTAGAILMEWNLRDGGQGAAGMWDSHFRVGGAVGSDLQVAQCPPVLEVNSQCIAATMLFHITGSGSGYFENVWAWVADHDIDDASQTQVSVFSARGILIESNFPTWLYGTASEHNVLYQYQTSNASNIFMGLIQTESPYYQPTPAAPAPFESTVGMFANDPDFVNCASGALTCAVSWALRVIDSSAIYIYGAGLYSWFNGYTQDCLASEGCQDAIMETSFSQGLWLYGLATKGSLEVVSPEGGTSLSQNVSQTYFTTNIAAYLPLALTGADIGGQVPGTVPTSPDCASIISIPGCTSGVSGSGTFTLTSDCVTAIAALPVSGANNIPSGANHCIFGCDLLRLLSGTCCGLGGNMCPSVLIPAGVPLPAQLGLPVDFVPPFTIVDHDGIPHPPNSPLSTPITVDAQTTFPDPFTLSPRTPLVDPVWVDSIFHESPASAPFVDLPCITAGTLIIDAACVAAVPSLPISSENNIPPGPPNYNDCNTLLRLVTGTCGGEESPDVTLANPVIVSAAVALPFVITLPVDFEPQCDLIINGFTIPALTPLTEEIYLPKNFASPCDLKIPAGSPLGPNFVSDSDADDMPSIGGFSTLDYFTWIKDPIRKPPNDTVIDDETYLLSWVLADNLLASPADGNPPWPTLALGIGGSGGSGGSGPSSSMPPPPAQTGTPPQMAGYQYVGCLADSADRVLPTQAASLAGMTVETCRQLCRGFGSPAFGVENGQECWCGDSTANVASSNQCGSGCGGDSNERCGGVWALDAYTTAAPAQPTPTLALQTANEWNYKGCWSDSGDSRLLSAASTSSDSMDIAECAAFCSSQSPDYVWLGVENGRECYCGSSLGGVQVTLDRGFCSASCAGNSGYACGGTWSISVYSAFGTNTLALDSLLEAPSNPDGIGTEAYYFYPTNPDSPAPDACTGSFAAPIVFTSIPVSSNPPFPLTFGLPFVNLFGMGTTCNWVDGEEDLTGNFNCEGTWQVVCVKHPSYGEVRTCGFGEQFVPVFRCEW